MGFIMSPELGALMYCSGLGALYGGAGGVWPLLLPRRSPHFSLRVPPTPQQNIPSSPPVEGIILLFFYFSFDYY